jgi:acyl CoA:acetate/3-ketoacid CoA transferase alpha subunit
MVGGFGVCGLPHNLVGALIKHGPKNLEVIANDSGHENVGAGLLVKQHMVKRLHTSYAGFDKELIRKFISGEIEIEFTP